MAEADANVVSDLSGLGERATSSPSPDPAAEGASAPRRQNLSNATTEAPSLNDLIAERVKKVKREERAARKRVGIAPGKNIRGTRAGAHIKKGENPNGLGGKEKGVKQPHLSPKVKQTRNELMLAAHLTGKTMGEIADAFGVSRLTVSEGITDAQRATYFGDARDYVRFRLIPKALRVLDKALDQGNVDVAQWVGEGAHVVGAKASTYDTNAGSLERAGASISDDFDTYRLEIIRRRRAQSAGDKAGAEEGPSEPSGDVIDAKVVQAADGLTDRK